MRPIKLTLNAFGPFVTRQEIDFPDSGNEEIFLVTGETGAGKTSVFDGICFALYGSASGDSRKPSSFKSDHAPDSELCFVEFTFLLRGNKYYLRRSPAQRGVKRDGSIKDIAPSAELIMPDGEVITGANAVTDRIEHVLGLNYVQFKQTTMLAQGEFKQLIEATGKEKQQIFSKIFGTSVYSDFTALLVGEEAALFSETQSLKEKIERCIRELGEYGHTALAEPDSVFLPFDQIEAAVTNSITLHKERLKYLDEEISKLESQKEKLNPARAQKLNEKLDRRDHLRKLLKELADKEPEILKQEKQVLLFKTALGLAEQEKIILASKSQAEQCEKQIGELEHTLSELEKRKQALLEAQNTPTPEIAALQSRLNTQKLFHDKLYREFIDGRSAFLAGSLEDGEACPVCGSLHHPSPAVQPDRLVTESDLNKAKADAEALASRLLREQDKLIAAYSQAKNDYGKYSALLETQKSHRDSLMAQFGGLRAEFVEKLDASGFAGYKDYRRALDGSRDLEQLTKLVADYREKRVATASQLKELELDTENCNREDLGALTGAYGEAERLLSALREDKTAIYIMLAGSEKRIAELKALHAENAGAERRYHIAHELASLAKGNRSVSFERYVLASYFDDIIKLANIHLQRMTNSRYKLKRLDDPGARRGAGSGLDMEIIDGYTGKSRDVSTLSGGESFKASLALALGLSGVVQIYSGGVSIDTMFIDEGFGSLDEKSLESAVETLISLKNSGRMVGIISHVPALREYIHKKLAVRYSPTGSTTGWV